MGLYGWEWESLHICVGSKVPTCMPFSRVSCDCVENMTKYHLEKEWLIVQRRTIEMVDLQYTFNQVYIKV